MRYYKINKETILAVNRQGKHFVISKEDYDEVSKYNWLETHNGYFSTMIKQKSILLHRMLMKTTSYVDHKNRNRRDNRRENLREATPSNNSMNRRKTRKKTSSRYKGVSLCKRTNKWVAQIKYNYKTTSIGKYDNEEDAGQAYNEKAKELFGEFAYLNVIDETE